MIWLLDCFVGWGMMARCKRRHITTSLTDFDSELPVKDGCQVDKDASYGRNEVWECLESKGSQWYLHHSIRMIRTLIIWLCCFVWSRPFNLMLFRWIVVVMFYWLKDGHGKEHSCSKKERGVSSVRPVDGVGWHVSSKQLLLMIIPKIQDSFTVSPIRLLEKMVDTWLMT